MTRFELTDRVAVVTGALGKLGPIWCETLLGAGARVAGIDLETVRESEAFSSLTRHYGPERVRLERGDVLDRGSLEGALDRIRGEWGVPEILINNAGIDQPPGDLPESFRVEDVPIDGFRQVLDVNTAGAFQAAQVFGGAMAEIGRGTIVNIGSLYASVSPDARLYDHIDVDPPFLKPPAYGASKAALINLTKYLATHWAPHGIRVNALSPGGVLGDQDAEFRRKFNARVPMGRMAEPDDLSGPLLFLASDASSYVTGIELRIDGGFSAW